ncbi:MAG: hypothetical protein RL026_2133 [Pseudomonadota bacterium]
MYRLLTRGRRWWIPGLALALVAGALSLWLSPLPGHLIRSRIESAAQHRGLQAQVTTVQTGLWPLLRLKHLDLNIRPGLRFHADSVSVTWPVGWRVAVQGARLSGPEDLELLSAASRWKVEGLLGGDLKLTLLDAGGGLTLLRQSAVTGDTWTLNARDLELGSLLELRREGLPLLTGGRAAGELALETGPELDLLRVDLGLRGTRLVSETGQPTDLALQFEGRRRKATGSLEIPGIRATAAGAALSGSLSVSDLDTDPQLDLTLGVTDLDFAQVLEVAGLALPERLQPAAGRAPDLGIATIRVDVDGRLAEPTSLVVTQKILFKPPRELPPALTALRGDFHFRPSDGSGQNRSIHVSPESPDFIAIGEVPPLFLRALTLAEDTDFYGHRGIDLREMPAALATNWSRGTAARGGSTISQQLAKNLFLSRDKRVGRKLQELPITFLLESTLGKQRILEIYLNIIEWGPDVRGLRPAARHYFGREPAALTAAEMAFLVSIIPGPILYQRSFADGTPGRGLRAMVNTLLAKLRSVDALSEEEYQQALADPLVIGEGSPAG